MPILTLLALLLAADPAPRAEPVELAPPTGTLFGVLDLPAGDGPFPAVLLHPGSGPTDRDGNQTSALIKPNSLKLLGRALADRGIAVLRIDKRGVAASGKTLAKEEDATIEMYAADAAAWLKFLRADKRFPKVGYIGHSEGAVIGLIAAQSAKVDAFVSLCGPGRRFADVLREQLKPKLTKGLFEKSEAILKALEAGRTVAEVPEELATLYRPSVQPFLISAFQLDPAKELAKLTCPVLVAHGTADIQVTEADAERLASARKDVQRLTVKEMNHVLKKLSDPKSQIEQLKAYMDPSLPVDATLVEGLVEFMRKAK